MCAPSTGNDNGVPSHQSTSHQINTLSLQVSTLTPPSGRFLIMAIPKSCRKQGSGLCKPRTETQIGYSTKKRTVFLCVWWQQPHWGRFGMVLVWHGPQYPLCKGLRWGRGLGWATTLVRLR